MNYRIADGLKSLEHIVEWSLLETAEEVFTLVEMQ